MLIAMDYDATYTADPEFWDEVVHRGLARGHSFVCVTGRSSPPEPPERRVCMPVVCAGSRFKRHAAAAAGFAVDVWIDDMPGTVEPQRLPSWPVEGGSDAA